MLTKTAAAVFINKLKMGKKLQLPKLQNKFQKGYIALISALVISALLVVICVAISATSFFLRFNVLDSEYKERSSELAESCVNIALLHLAQNPSNTATGNVVVGDDSCTIFSVQKDYPAAGQTTVQTKAEVRHAVTNFKVTVDVNLSIISWQELPSL